MPLSFIRQIMPPILSILGVDDMEKDSLDFGTIIVYTCKDSVGTKSKDPHRSNTHIPYLFSSAPSANHPRRACSKGTRQSLRHLQDVVRRLDLYRISVCRVSRSRMHDHRYSTVIQSAVVHDILSVSPCPVSNLHLSE